MADPSQDQNEAIEHDRWFREQVQEALDNPGPGIPHEVIKAETLALIDGIAEKLRKARGE
jgi:hypothetical protein